MNKKLKNILWKGFGILPKPLRARLARKIFFINLDVNSSDIIFKLAETKEEIFEALNLIQVNYKRLKMTKDNYDFRITKFNFLATTSTFIAKSGDEIIGTVSLVLDTNLGLPIDHFIDITEFRKRNKIAEFTGLTVKEEWRSKSTGISLPLALMALDYGIKILKADYLFLTVRKSVSPFYEDICGFKKFGKDRKHDKMQNLKSSALYVDTSNIMEDLKCFYKKKPLHKNMHLLLSIYPWKRLEPKGNTELLLHPIYLKKDFFNELKNKTELLENLSKNEIQTISNSTNYYPGRNPAFLVEGREYYRYPVHFEATVDTGHHEFKVIIVEVSLNGLILLPKENLNLTENMQLKIKSINSCINFVKKYQRISSIGCEIISHDQQWKNFIMKLEKQCIVESVEEIDDLAA